MSFTYTVACDFDDEATADAWVRWLAEEHVREVCDAGAVDGEVVKIAERDESCRPRFEVRYHFASREAFEAYELDHAPRLREEGLARFPLELGLHYTRCTGEVVA